jgi:hypothetical protein
MVGHRAEAVTTRHAARVRLGAFLRAHPRTWLVLAAVVPFIPGACQFIHRGIPDVLFTGDGATLELRVLHAAHATQQLGPYSRFQWSHPGPAFFYLAVPIYELFHERGPALNLFAFLANLASVVALVFSAWRLRGSVFALSAATLLAVYECVNPQFQLSSEWNPMTPILPLALLTLLGARLALGSVELLPLFAFVASAIVQTHIGFVPVVASLSAIAAVLGLARRLAGRRPPAQAALARTDTHARRKRAARALAATACVLVIAWSLPFFENATRPRGNLGLLYQFFTTPHAPEHDWRVVVETVAQKIAFLPLVAPQWAGFATAPSFALALRVGIAEVVALGAALATGLRRRDDGLAVLSSIALGEIAASLAAVRAIRGEIHPYLVVWITIVGWVAATAILAWVLSIATPWRKRRGAYASLGLAALALFLVCLREQARRVDVFRSRDEDAERLARDVEQYLASEHVNRPLIRIASHDQWPTAVAVVLDLFKHKVPIFVERSWLFMMGTEFAATSPEHPLLEIGDRAFYEWVRQRPDFHFISMAGDTCAFLADPGYLRAHRLAETPRLVSATGVVRDPAVAVDGVIPADGTPWDSPLSVILTSTASSIEVTVPHADVVGVFLTVDGSDRYSVHCNGNDGRSALLGSVVAGVPIGMGTAFLFSDEVQSCKTVTVKPEWGDGLYSVGEIGFLKRE